MRARSSHPYTVLRRTPVAAAIAALVLVVVSGCGTVIRFGSLPDTGKLDTDLTLGLSKQSDVLEALGEPRNRGQAMLPGQDSQRDLWCYYYEEGTLSDDRRIFLFVFFKEGVYDGYMWFSSLPST